MTSVNEEQAEFWGNSEQGTKWLTYEAQLDHAFAPVLDLVLDRAALSAGMQVLDIGCGTGLSSIAAARAVGAEGHVLAADISQPFLDRAAKRAESNGIQTITFQHADAQTYAFEPGQMDAAISRFGVMFFSDSIAAFRNIALALKPGGQMTFASWGPLDVNPWFKIPHVAAVRRMGQPPRVDRYAPGPLAFHDIDHVKGLMTQAGLSEITGDAITVNLTDFGGVEGTARLVTRVGPAGRVVAHFEGSEADTDAIQEAVAKEFRQYKSGSEILIPAMINLYQARRAE